MSLQDAPTVNPRLRTLEVANEEGIKFMPHGESGEDAIGSIPFQVFRQSFIDSMFNFVA